MYGKGDGTLKDPKKAFYWYEKAANQGDAFAQFNLGVSYFHGEGTIVDKKKAAYWIEQAYNNNDVEEAKEFWEKNQLWKYK